MAKHFMTQLAVYRYAFTIISSQRLEAAEFIVKERSSRATLKLPILGCEVHSTARRDGRWLRQEPEEHGARNLEV